MKAERIQKTRRKKARKRSRFLSNPYGLSKEVLEKKKAGQLNCSTEEVEEHLKNTHSDQARHMQMDCCIYWRTSLQGGSRDNQES
ncbi:hypothetical protein DPMN_092189 [Dreissena polymorpha]|uniref:Uncharacterized protein n=1 Tax=Dreissena polymorpha TaxID=45954 RepID=A0A9D4L0V8_DREPO|nr:hypothetical protein DPMN_092189 [Dreissena polymorpha]